MSKARPLTRRWLVAAIITVALVQTAALAKMVTDRAALLRDGIENMMVAGRCLSATREGQASARGMGT